MEGLNDEKRRPAGGAESAEPDERAVGRLCAETSERIASALTDRMRELAAAWVDKKWNGRPVVVREAVGQGLELSMEVRYVRSHVKLLRLRLEHADGRLEVAKFEMRDDDAGFLINHRWVEPDWRGGTGTLLLAKLEQFAQQVTNAKSKPLACVVDIGQPDVISFFEHNGYAPASPELFARMEEGLRTGEIIVDQGYMYPKDTSVLFRDKHKSLSAVRVRMRKQFDPSPRRKYWRWF